MQTPYTLVRQRRVCVKHGLTMITKTTPMTRLFWHALILNVLALAGWWEIFRLDVRELDRRRLYLICV